MFAGSRSDIHHAVCRTHCIFIMLDHDQTVSEIAKAHQRTKKSVIVSLMKTDTWLIQNVRNSDQSGTNLCRKSDSLRLATGKRRCRTAQRQVIQSDFCKKTYSCTDFFQNLFSDQLLLLRQLQFFHKNFKFRYGKCSQLIDITFTHSYCQRFLFQTLAFTGLTRSNAHKSFVFLLHRIRSCLTVSLLNIFNQARESNIIDSLSSLTFIINLDCMTVCTMDQNIFYLVRVVFKRCVQTEPVFFCKSIQNCSRKASLIRTGLPAHYSDRALRDA